MLSYTIYFGEISENVNFQNKEDAEAYFMHNPEAKKLCITENGQVIKVIAERKLIFG